MTKKRSKPARQKAQAPRSRSRRGKTAPKDGLVSWTILAAKLGCSVPTLYSWRGRPDAPTEPHLEKWKAYAAANELGAAKKDLFGDLRAKKAEAEIDFIRARTARARRETILLSELNEMHLELATQVRAELYHWMESALPPKLEGREAAKIRILLREAADSICDKMADKLKRFEEDR